MTDADNSPDSGSAGAAAGAELSIPKYRFDELRAELARSREDNEIKNRLLTETIQRNQPQNQGPAPMTAEESGLDPQTFQAVMKIAERIAESKIAPERALLGQQIGLLASKTEQTSLLATKGSDKAKYLSDIKKMQMDHNRETGGFMPAETCLEILQSREKDAKIKSLEAQLAGGNTAAAPAATIQEPSQGIPNAAATRQIPAGGAAAVGKKTFSESTLEEMEARLQEQFTAGNTL